MKKQTLRIAFLVIALTALAALAAFAQDAETADPATDDAATAAVTDAATIPSPMLLNLNLEWVNSDICRIIEELRRTKDPWQRRDMIEQIEYMIYKHIEHPLLFKQAESTDQLDLDRIGAVSDVVDAGTANPLSPLIGEAFALYGIAKGYEGYAAAANDWLKRAKAIYPTVEAVTVKIDTYQDRRPIREWMTESLGSWARTDTVRVTIHGKKVTQASVAKVTEEKITFVPKKGSVGKYYLHVASIDFQRGMQRYIVTSEKLTERRPNKFEIYLPPGKYIVGTGTSVEMPIVIKVSSDPSKNHFMVETLNDSITLYPKPRVSKKSKQDKPE